MSELFGDAVPRGAAIEKNRAFIFRDGDLLLLNGRIPSVVEASMYLKLRLTGAMGSLAPEGCIWGCVDDTASLPEGWSMIDRRSYGEKYGMNAFHAMSTAWGFVDWQKQAQFCGVCGSRMAPAPDEPHAMRCMNCGHTLFPVICPAMIVAVERDGKLLMGRNSRFRQARYSVLAGFLESGESMEDAVVREVREEVNIEVDRDSIEYVSSQYWPFPRSLMLACRARWKSGEIRPDGVEILDARWFGPDEMPDNIPSTVTVAGQLIRDFMRRHGKMI